MVRVSDEQLLFASRCLSKPAIHAAPHPSEGRATPSPRVVPSFHRWSVRCRYLHYWTNCRRVPSEANRRERCRAAYMVSVGDSAKRIAAVPLTALLCGVRRWLHAPVFGSLVTARTCRQLKDRRYLITLTTRRGPVGSRCANTSRVHSYDRRMPNSKDKSRQFAAAV